MLEPDGNAGVWRWWWWQWRNEDRFFDRWVGLGDNWTRGIVGSGLFGASSVAQIDGKRIGRSLDLGYVGMATSGAFVML